MKNQYRFKTKKEFKKDFGENWRVISDFVAEMDYLFNKQLTENETKDFLKGELRIDYWKINPKMIKTTRNKKVIYHS